MKQKALSEEHPSVAATLGNMAGVYGAQGRFEEAAVSFTSAAVVYGKAYGDGHSQCVGAREMATFARSRAGRQEVVMRQRRVEGHTARAVCIQVCCRCISQLMLNTLPHCTAWFSGAGRI